MSTQLRLSNEIPSTKMHTHSTRLDPASLRLRSRAGFTLVEIVVVMLLLGIVGAVVIPGFFRSSLLGTTNDTTKPIVQLLKSAQKLAIKSNTPVRVVIDLPTSRYQVTGRDIDTLVASGVLELPVSARMTSDSARVMFKFLPTGDALSDSLLVSSTTGSTLIKVNPWTGAIIARAR